MTLYIITGPPAAGKTTYVRQHAKHGDITIDYDALAGTLTPPGGQPHDPPTHIKTVTKAARQAAIDTAIQLAGQHDVYIIHSTLGTKRLNHYLTHDATVITINPGRDTVLARCKNERPWYILQAAKQWYDNDERHSDDQPITSLGKPSEQW